MKVGTRSLLFGVHQVALHPFFVALAWRRLYGSWPWGWRVWLLILVHDWGYWGCETMDGPDGKLHPWWAAEFAHRFLDRRPRNRSLGRWGRFALFHSRSMARRYGQPVSPLCAPDKLGAVLMPRWLYLFLARLSGELAEYMANADCEAGRAQAIDISTPEAWFDTLRAYLERISFGIVRGEEPGVPPEDAYLPEGGAP